jgi:cobalt-zinc-cadmium efflux system outer membrane protein
MAPVAGVKKLDTVLRIDQLVERGGKRDLRVEVLNRGWPRVALIWTTPHDSNLVLRYAYYNLRLAQEKLMLARETAELYGKSADAGRLRQKVGDIAPVDVSRLQIDKARADSDVRQTQTELEQSQQALAYLIGREPDARQTRCR